MSSDEQSPVAAFLEQGGSLYMLADVEQSDLEQLYGYACQLLRDGDSHRALRILYLLVRADQWNFRYWLALGQVCQRNSQHEEALACFAKAGMLGVSDPRPAYFAGCSYQLLGNHDYASKAFNAAILWCGDQEQYADMAHRARRALGGAQLKEKQT